MQYVILFNLELSNSFNRAEAHKPVLRGVTVDPAVAKRVADLDFDPVLSVAQQGELAGRLEVVVRPVHRHDVRVAGIGGVVHSSNLETENRLVLAAVGVGGGDGAGAGMDRRGFRLQSVRPSDRPSAWPCRRIWPCRWRTDLAARSK